MTYYIFIDLEDRIFEQNLVFMATVSRFLYLREIIERLQLNSEICTYLSKDSTLKSKLSKYDKNKDSVGFFT